MFLAIGDANQVKQITGKDQQEILADPQALNSYSYANNNPITQSDPTGRCPMCVLAIGTLAMYSPQITSYAQSLLTPLGQIGINQATEDVKQGNYLWAGIGFLTAGDVPGRNIGNLSKLEKLPQISVKLPDKFDKLLELTGKNNNKILSEASKFGEAFIDNANNGNVNIFVQRSEKLITRVTTNPEITKIISVGTNKVKDIVRWSQNNRLTPMNKAGGNISHVINNIINSLHK